MLPVQDSSLKHVVCSLSLNGAATERWMNDGSMEQGIGRPQSKLIAQRTDHLKLRWDMILLSSRSGFLVWMALNSRIIPFGQDMRMRFMHAIQSFLQISYWHQCIWVLFNLVVRFRVMHMTWPRFIFDPPLHVQPRRTNVGNNEVLEQLWKEILSRAL